MKAFTVKETTNLKDFTSAVYPQGAFCLSVLLRAKDIKVNGARVKSNVPLFVGDEVIYYTTPAQEGKKSHNTVFEDENVYIADKFSGVSSEGLLSELCSGGEYYACHRLDRNTQGLIVFAKNRRAEGEILAAFKERRVQKIYLAVCMDCFKSDKSALYAYLKKDEAASRVSIYGKEKSGAARIITEYEVIKRADGLALVKIILHTGKTHQIRAHMAYIGCPVLGDEKYGDGELNKKYNLKRQQLVSKYLSINTDGALSYLNGRVFESSLSLNI